MEKNLRQIREELEKNTLSEFACLATDTKGRKVYEEPCEMRTDFARDRDRIIHCRTFRRLKHKTQVFLSPEGDHYRTRLTHTLEVAQIARTLARALNLNEDLTEAVALGHDLGHTPFGHAGEGVLAKISPLGFKHYEQSVRVVEFLEKGGKGLNLTHEVIDGIRCHTRGTEAETLEGRIVRYADKIAYINHDIDDAVRGMIISEDELPKEAVAVLGNTKSKRIDTLLRGVIAGSMGKNEIKMTDEVFAAFDLLHDFMFDRVYLGSRAKEEEKKAEQIVEMLYNHYFNDVDKLPDFYKEIAEKEGKDRAVCDFVAGMTDRYAISKFEEIFLPKTWNLK